LAARTANLTDFEVRARRENPRDADFERARDSRIIRPTIAKV
jgi:hypothetical protein